MDQQVTMAIQIGVIQPEPTAPKKILLMFGAGEMQFTIMLPPNAARSLGKQLTDNASLVESGLVVPSSNAVAPAGNGEVH